MQNNRACAVRENTTVSHCYAQSGPFDGQTSSLCRVVQPKPKLLNLEQKLFSFRLRSLTGEERDLTEL